MSKIVILGGTSEGRELAEYARQKRIPVVVTVVSEYGEQLLPEDSCVRIHQGRLDHAGMERFLIEERPQLVLDATHPYAREVTETAREVCSRLGLSCRRVLRKAQHTSGESLVEVSSAAEAAAFLAEREGAVFLTTGSRELGAFASDERLRERLYARILPDSQVVAACESLGVRGSHLIAMQGPFSMEMNVAMIRQTGARWLVTKESGSRGGFAQKLEAAVCCGIGIVVIRRPLREEGISLREALRLLDEFAADEPVAGEPVVRRVSLIGMGMSGRHLTMESVEALKSCDALLGAQRMLDAAAEFVGAVPRAARYRAEPVLEWLTEHPECVNAAVVCSGDTGFYSGSLSLVKALREEGFCVRICPGVPSAAALAARLGCGWEDWHLVSAHGRDVDPVLLLGEYEKVFLLLGGMHAIRDVCLRLTNGGWGTAWVTAGIRLGYPQEQVLSGTAASFAEYAGDDGLSCILLERTGTVPEYLPDDIGQEGKDSYER